MTQTVQTDQRLKGRTAHTPHIGPHHGHKWLEEFHHAGAAAFEKIGWPSTDDEQWRYINITPITQTSFRPAAGPGSADRGELAGVSLAGRGFYELVFVDGHFSPELSEIGDLARLIEFQCFHDASGDRTDRIRRYLGHELPAMSNGFAALNTAGFSDGIFLYLLAGVAVQKPIHILWFTTRHARPTVVFPRCLISAGSGSQATIIQSFASLESDHPPLTNAATEVICGRDSRLELIKLEREAPHAFHVANEAVHVHAGAKFQSLTFNAGALLVRNNMTVYLAEPFGEATLNGLTISSGNQHVDNHTMLDHAAENCPSHELYKSLLAGNAAGVFRGRILVRPDAQKTDSKQTSKTMLLSDDAVMNSQPQLEIYANDVKCTHGSTTGPIDEEQLFYLQSRGVSAARARSLLTYAFAGDVLNRIIHPEVREYISTLTSECLHRMHIESVES